MKRRENMKILFGLLGIAAFKPELMAREAHIGKNVILMCFICEPSCLLYEIPCVVIDDISNELWLKINNEYFNWDYADNFLIYNKVYNKKGILLQAGEAKRIR